MGDVLYQFLPIDVGIPLSLRDVVVRLVDVVVDATVENNLVVSTFIVDLLGVIFGVGLSVSFLFRVFPVVVPSPGSESTQLF